MVLYIIRSSLGCIIVVGSEKIPIIEIQRYSYYRTEINIVMKTVS